MLRAALHNRHLDNVELVADGGITALTAPQTIEAGTDTLVAGSAIFNSTAADLSTAVQGLAQPAQNTATVRKR
ncbi:MULTISPECIES: hypothetical protein [Nocardia]|uniref:hypothetical protein n=1 Tax=Nocardia TaxID=1817 RepID=UPI000BEF3B3D|nr:MULTISPECIES: hypothetical protein [Nocardia]PEH79453.1 hypothetical protein CRM89_28645 [Nocardia sp. FDAARGOS_372]